MGFRSSDELSRHIKSTHETQNMPGFSIGATRLATLPEEDQLELLYDAMANGQFDAVRNLASESVLAKAPETVIERAGSLSPPDLLSWLLDHDNYKLSLPRDAYTDRALHAAIEGENLPNIKLLLSRGADLMSGCPLESDGIYSEYPSPSGILRAFRRWNGALMKFLVEDCGATISHTWGKGHASAIFCARQLSDANLEDARGRFRAMKPYILWPEAYTLAPYYAVQSRSPALVRISLENGGDPNQSPTTNGYMALHECVHKPVKILEITELLLEYKANPNATGGQRSALEMVVLSGRKFSSTRMDCAKLLLRHGADPNGGYIEGKLTYRVVRAGRSEMVKLLLQHGADPDLDRVIQMKRLSGMKKIEKYFGMPWHDIVRRIQAGEVVERKGSG